MPVNKTLPERFWKKVKISSEDECWEWQGMTIRSGYGRIYTGNYKKELAHRVAWQLTYGDIPDGEGYHGTCVLHTCDNRKCVNPKHLFIGSHADNIHDMCRKGRYHQENIPFGEGHANHKLTDEQIGEIRAMHGMSQRQLASMYGVIQQQISRIKRFQRRSSAGI